MFKFRQRAEITRRSLWSLANKPHTVLFKISSTRWEQDPLWWNSDTWNQHKPHLTFFCCFVFVMNFPLYFLSVCFQSSLLLHFSLVSDSVFLIIIICWVFLVSRLLQKKRHIVMAVNMKSWRNVGLVDKFDRNYTDENLGHFLFDLCIYLLLVCFMRVLYFVFIGFQSQGFIFIWVNWNSITPTFSFQLSFCYQYPHFACNMAPVHIIVNIYYHLRSCYY